MIQTSYDPEADVLYVKFGAPDARPDGSEEVAPGVFLEYDKDNRLMAVEIISVRLRSTQTSLKAAAE